MSEPPRHPEPASRQIHWLRWLAAAFLSGATFVVTLLPLQAVEILHFRIYEVIFEPLPQFIGVAWTVLLLAGGLGLAVGALGIAREAWMERRPRPWPWWAPVTAALPAALLVHAFEWPGFAAAALLPHVIANGADRERRWIRLGVMLCLLLALPFTNPVRRLYAERVIRVFHFQRLRYSDVFLFARKGGRRAQAGEYRGYLPSIEELPVRPGELFWLGIVSLTVDPWGHPYHFVQSRHQAAGAGRPDFGLWEIDYTYASYGADGIRGGTDEKADIFPENAVDKDLLPPPRPQPMRDPAAQDREIEARAEP